MSTPSTPTCQTITEDVFEATYKPMLNHLDSNASWNGCMFETYGEELVHVKAIYKENPDRVWTVLDVDGALMLDSGMSFVNRMGYVITELPAPADTFISVQDEDDDLNSSDSDDEDDDD